MSLGPGDRYAHVRALTADRARREGLVGVAGSLASVCRCATTELGAAGAAVLLMSDDGVDGVAASSDAGTAILGEIAFTTGEGPCLVAWRSRRLVLVRDLNRHAAQWPGYSTGMLEAGIHAVMAVPLLVGAVGFGVLGVFDGAGTSMDKDRVATATTFARVATEILLLDGTIDPHADGLLGALAYRAEVHQSQGMVMVALGIGLLDALTLLRARSFSLGMPLVELARRVVAGDEDPQSWDA